VYSTRHLFIIAGTVQLHGVHILFVLDFGFGGTAAIQPGVAGAGVLGGGVAPGQQVADATAAAIAQQNQQQLLQLTNSPYGDSPLFRNLREVLVLSVCC